MEKLIFIILNSIIQIVIFSILPFIYYIIKYKKIRKFCFFLGLKKTTTKTLYLSVFFSTLFLLILITLLILSNEFKNIISSQINVSGELKVTSIEPTTIIIIFIIAFFKTALAEEIFFRGFLAKIFIKYLGFNKGNFIQASLFSFIHFILFLQLTNNFIFLLYSFIFPFIFSITSVYINEKKGNGSILPSIIMHSFTNFISYIIVIYFI